MSKLDLEKMQGAWRQHSQRLDASLSLDIAGVRTRLKLGTQSAFKRHLRWLAAETVFGAATLIALLVFIASQRNDLVYLAAALPLLAMVLCALAIDIRHWQILSALNLSAPIVQVRAVVDAVRRRRLLVVKWIVLCACLLWLPLIAVLLKAVFSVDLLRGLHISVVAVNVLLGVLLIPIGLVVFGWFAKRFANAPAFQRLAEDASGSSFSAARASFESEANFESDLVNGLAQAEWQLQQNQWPDYATVQLQSFRKSLLFGILFYALLMFCMASFNFVHGGNVHALLPGIFLHLTFVLQMVAGIVHRQLLKNLAAGGAQALAAQMQSLQQMAHWRGNVARISIVLSPLLVLALLQVFGYAIFALDLYASVGAGVAITSLTAAVAFAIVLSARWHAIGNRFAQRLCNAIAFGSLKRTQGLLGALELSSAGKNSHPL